MSWIAIGCVALLPLFLVAVLGRRPVATGAVGGLLFGPVLYLALGLFLARQRGTGRFFSVPFGGDRVGDAEIMTSLAFWSLVIGVALGLATHLLVHRRHAGPA